MTCNKVSPSLLVLIEEVILTSLDGSVSLESDELTSVEMVAKDSLAFLQNNSCSLCFAPYPQPGLPSPQVCSLGYGQLLFAQSLAYLSQSPLSFNNLILSLRGNLCKSLQFCRVSLVHCTLMVCAVELTIENWPWHCRFVSYSLCVWIYSFYVAEI